MSTAKKIAVKIKPNLNPWLPLGSRQEEVQLQGRELTLTNLQKVYWPKDKVLKRDLLEYYHNMQSYILPYLVHRPQSLNRFPNGIEGMNFYQKNVEGKVADWIKTYSYLSESDHENKEFLVCDGEASLIYMANLGCIEMNPWHSRIQSPDLPDWCVIDLDPDGNSFDQVVEAAQATRSVLELLKVRAYCKTSGATGMHIYIPLGASYSYDQSRMFASAVAGRVNKMIPSFTSLERTPAKRKKKIYLDFLQNKSIQTIASPYSLRPRPGAPVSTPLDWNEVKKGLRPLDFTIHNIADRLLKKGDLFKPVLQKGVDLKEALQKLESSEEKSR